MLGYQLEGTLRQSVEENCGGDFVNVHPSNVNCGKDLHTISECISGLYDQHILDLNCVTDSTTHNYFIRHKILLEENLPNIVRSRPQEPGLECMSYRRMLSYYWANDNGTVKEWVRCNSSNLHYAQNVNSSISYHLNLSKKGHYRSLIYSGDHDMIVPFFSTEEWTRSLKYAISEEWRPWLVDDQIAGYVYNHNLDYNFELYFYVMFSKSI
ncbi:sinapoylglucose--choline O-sinapoyltransferase [Ranunculus cassubicifolius]